MNTSRVLKIDYNFVYMYTYILHIRGKIRFLIKRIVNYCNFLFYCKTDTIF